MPFSLPEQVPTTLEEALQGAREVFVPHDLYSIRTSPRFWRDVFIRFYGSEPVHNDDPRWDSLFTAGFDALEELLKKS